MDPAAGQPAPGTEIPRTDLLRQKGSLSDKLNADNGVIRPEGPVDPNIPKRPPATGTTPVIRPPESPDGAHGAQPNQDARRADGSPHPEEL
ncbi:MAG: hypothetical protein ABSG83_16510, partial [Roseiarcus sp.]